MSDILPTPARATSGRRVAVQPIRGRRVVGSVLKHGTLIMVAVAFLLPFYWIVISAFKDNQQIFARPVTWWPDPIRWENFSNALNYPGFPYLRLLWNTIYYSGAVTIGTVLSSAAVGYGFAKLNFPGRNVLFGVTIATLMIPAIVTFIPTYLLFAKVGLTGSYAPLIIPAFLGNPRDLSDAARIDGAGEFRLFWEIMLPLVRPALIVVAVFSLLYTWQDFFGPLIYLQDRDSFPLSLGLYAFRAQRTAEWALTMMGSLLTTLPLIVVFLFTQRYFLQGVTMTGIKG